MTSELTRLLAELCDRLHWFTQELLKFIEEKGLTKEYAEWQTKRNKEKQKRSQQ